MYLLEFYDEVCEFVWLMILKFMEIGGCENVIVIGGGSGVMEVGNCGVVDVGGKLIGLNIVLFYE